MMYSGLATKLYFSFVRMFASIGLCQIFTFTGLWEKVVCHQ